MFSVCSHLCFVWWHFYFLFLFLAEHMRFVFNCFPRQLWTGTLHKVYLKRPCRILGGGPMGSAVYKEKGKSHFWLAEHSRFPSQTELVGSPAGFWASVDRNWSPAFALDRSHPVSLFPQTSQKLHSSPQHQRIISHSVLLPSFLSKPR